LFLGQITGEIKREFRVSLPACFLGGTTDGMYITQGFDGNLLVLPSHTFDHLVQHLSSLNLADPLARLLSRMLLGRAEFLEAGQDATLTLPKELAGFAGLTDGIIFVGQGDYFELWSPDRWEKQKELLRDVQANAQRFSAFQISTRP